MKHPEEICAEITAALTADSFGFYYGTPPDLNFEADELTYPMVFLEKPVSADVLNTKSGTREVRVNVALLFTYLVELDETEPNKFAMAKAKAWDAAREFVLRLRKYDDWIKDVTSEKLEDVDHLFDINLAGCVAYLSFVIVDAGPICLT